MRITPWTGLSRLRDEDVCAPTKAYSTVKAVASLPAHHRAMVGSYGPSSRYICLPLGGGTHDVALEVMNRGFSKRLYEVDDFANHHLVTRMASGPM